MANYKTVFLGTESSETQDHELLCYANDANEIFIQISMLGWENSFICLDESTAIKLSKTLRTHINIIKQD
tara:strand:+ start:209 stop:418 length:210 start_codon:yes stop_codon:yes gene_type:complete